MTQRYELVLRGEIGDRFGLLFEGMRLERGRRHTVLTAPCATRRSCTGSSSGSRSSASSSSPSTLFRKER